MNLSLHDYQPPPHQGLTIIFQDEDLLAVDKPSGLLSLPGRGAHKQDCLLARVRLEYPEALAVHRLDMATSGLMLLARNETMQSRLGRLFEQRQIEKRYIAVVAGQPTQDCDTIDLPLITDWPQRPLQKIDHELGKRAISKYRLVDYDPAQDISRIELIPETGRTHQLRIHMQAIGHPILGDRLYAPAEIQQKSERLLLHAELLRFIHPVNRKEIEIKSEVPF